MDCPHLQNVLGNSISVFCISWQIIFVGLQTFYYSFIKSIINYLALEALEMTLLHHQQKQQNRNLL